MLVFVLKKMICIAVANFNEIITEKLLRSTTQYLNEKGVEYEVFEVPGAVELPLIVQQKLKNNSFLAAIALGCVIKGETDHYELVIQSSTQGLTRVALDEEKPVIQGVLACRNFEQAWARRNLGKNYAQTALKMLEILQK
jgi:6,7-dimethyl-8-ribityllumazine synthase